MADDKIVDRILALLAKAESTDFPAESDAFTAKAHELMREHAVDLAVERAQRTDRPSGDITTRVVHCPAPYASAKYTLLHSIALTNSVRAMETGRVDGAQITLVGYPEDLDNVEALFASLIIQATRAVLAARVPVGDSARGFRHAFLIAFANRIHSRLEAVTKRIVDDAPASTALILRTKGTEVELRFRELFPRTRLRSNSVSSRQGRLAGYAAANSADLGQQRIVHPRLALDR